jgi:hypothetical protein
MHLGLDVPEGVAITVGGTTVEWREGKVITFDDSYRHSVEHNGDRDRCLHSFFGLHAAVWFGAIINDVAKTGWGQQLKNVATTTTHMLVVRVVCDRVVLAMQVMNPEYLIWRDGPEQQSAQRRIDLW